MLSKCGVNEQNLKEPMTPTDPRTEDDLPDLDEDMAPLLEDIWQDFIECDWQTATVPTAETNRKEELRSKAREEGDSDASEGKEDDSN